MFNYGHLYFYLVESIQPNHQDSDTEDISTDTVTARPLKKGQNLLASNFVENVQDNLLPNGDYLLRSHVHHSMKKLVPLNVTVILSGQSGGIKKCSCSCKASECNRCAHVTALLLFLDDFVKKNGYAITTPSTSSSICMESRKKER